MVGVAVLGSLESIVGFKLAGVKAFECGEIDCDEIASRVLSDEDVGLLIVPNDVVSKLSQKTRRILESSSKPVVVFIPGKDGRVEKSSSIQVMLKRAIGVDLSKK